MVIFRKFCGLLLPVAMMFLFNSCTSYYMVSRPLDDALEIEGAEVLVMWGGKVFELSQAYVVDKRLTGVMVGLDLNSNLAGKVDEEFNEFSKEKVEEFDEFPEFKSLGTKVTTHAIHILVSPEHLLPTGYDFYVPQDVSIPLDQIMEVQVREFHAGMAIVKTFGAMVLMAGVAFIIILATKDSCPFIYVLDGDDAHLVGEIYSGAIHPPLERHDYLPLPIAGDGPCQLKITNEVLEIQHTNLAELLVYDHAPDQRVLLDRHGRAHLVGQPVPPATTKSFSVDETGMEGQIFTFDRDLDANTMQLVVNARNSRWLDHVLGMVFEQMGDLFKPWQEAQKSGSPENMRRWSQEQGLPLAVSLQTPDGWQYVDYMDLVGPIASRESVIGIDVSGLSGDQVSVKIEYGYRFWDIESTTASFTSTAAPLETTVALDQATDQDGLDVRHLLVGDDDLYLHQPDYTDVTLMNFNLPTLAPGMSRSVILHSKGHYDILRDPSGMPDASFIASFTKPASVPTYSREMYRALNNQAGN